MSLTLTAVAEPDLLLLPWHLPLEEWPDDVVVALPRGISRHIVRFVRINGHIYAVKETLAPVAQIEYDLLMELAKRNLPCVEAFGVVDGRTTVDGEPLPAALITRHLQFSLPYRALFSTSRRGTTATRLVDALALLLVELHLAGFAWKDCSLSNTLFRRDAGAFAAYLVDAETGELHDRLSDGQRENDLDVATVNVSGELMDLEAGGLLHPTIDPVQMGQQLRVRYETLWDQVLAPVVMNPGERYRLEERIRALNSLGFDVAEMQARQDGSGIIVMPKVVDAGHHARRLLRLTGLDAEENQARRMLNDLDSYRLELGLSAEDEEIAAHRWVSEVFEPTTALIPSELRHKLEPAQIFHEVLEHRWFLSERAGHDVGLRASMQDYIDNVLPNRPDEETMLGFAGGTSASGDELTEPIPHPSDDDPMQDTMVMRALKDLPN